MADVRRKHDSNTEDIETFVSVKNLLKEFGEKSSEINNNDETYTSVRERLRRIDTRQESGYDCNSDNNDNVISREIQQNRTPVSLNRDSIGSYTTTPGKPSPVVSGPLSSSPIFVSALCNANLSTPRTKFGHLKSPNTRKIFSNSLVTNVSDRKSFPPPPVQSHTEVEDSHHSSTSFSHHSSTSLKENSGVKEVCSKYGNVMLKKVEKPIEDKWKNNLTIESSLTHDDTRSIGEDGSGHLSQSSGFSIGRGDTTNERTKRRSFSRTKSDRATPKRKSSQYKVNTSTSSQVSAHTKTFSFASPSSASCKKPQSLKNRCKSLPNFAEPEEDQLSPSVREERYQNDLAAALKKVGLPLEEKWKYKKNSDEENADSSKPLYATVKLRSVGIPTHSTRTAASPASTSSKVNEELQRLEDQRTPNCLKQKFEFNQDDKKSTFVKRQRVPSTVSDSEKRQMEGISVSNLAKSFSSNIKLASEEKNTERVSSEGNEITRIRNSLKSTAQELEDVRKSLSSTPVSKMIAERNKAAQNNRSQGKEVLNRTKLRRSKSMSSARAKTHRVTKSMTTTTGKWPLTHIGISSIDGHSSLGLPQIPLCKRSRDGDLMSTECNNVFKVDCPDGWENFKVNDITESGGIWDMDLDDPHFFEDNVSCPAFDDYYDDNISGTKDDPFPLNSLTSEGSTDSEGDFYYRNYGQSRYIQITLSSGGITEKFEPAIVMSASEESFVSYPEGFSFPMDHQTDMTQDSMSDSKRDKKKTLKGAKKFFFGKNKKKNALVEV